MRFIVGPFGSARTSASPYFVQDLGPASDQGDAKMLGLNDLGEVVGTNPNTSHAFYWTATSGGEIDINASLAHTAPASSQA